MNYKINNWTTYQRFNIFFVIILSCILLLLYLSISKGWLTCSFNSNLGIQCASCGMSRDFSQFLSGNLANPLNPYSLRVFIFFIGQIIFRLVLGISGWWKNDMNFIRIDIVISIFWATWCFVVLLF